MLMYLINILIAGYGMAHFKVQMVVATFRQRDRTLTLPRILWSKPLGTATLSQLAFQLTTSSIEIPKTVGC